MSKITGNTQGIHQANQNYEMNARGKFGDRQAKLNDQPTASRSSTKPNVFTRMGNRLATMLPTQSAKVRRFNLKQKEMGRHLGNTLGQLASPDTAKSSKKPIDRLIQLTKMSTELDSKIEGEQPGTRLRSQMDSKIDSMDLATLKTLQQELQNVNVDQHYKTVGENSKTTLESIHVVGEMQRDVKSDINNELAQVKDVKQQMLQVLDAKIKIKELKLQFDFTARQLQKNGDTASTVATTGSLISLAKKAQPAIESGAATSIAQLIENEFNAVSESKSDGFGIKTLRNMLEQLDGVDLDTHYEQLIQQQGEESRTALEAECRVVKDVKQELKQILELNVFECQVGYFKGLEEGTIDYNDDIAKECFARQQSPKDTVQWMKNGLSVNDISRLLDNNFNASMANRMVRKNVTVDQLLNLQKRHPDASPSKLMEFVVAATVDSGLLDSLTSHQPALSSDDILLFSAARIDAAELQSLASQNLSLEQIRDEAQTRVETREVGWDPKSIEFGPKSDLVVTESRSVSGGAMAETLMVKQQTTQGQEVTVFFSKESPDPPPTNTWNAMFNQQPPSVSRMAQRNIASSKLDEALGLGLLAKSELGKLRHPETQKVMVGTFMDGALGKATQDIPVELGEWKASSDNPTVNGLVTQMLADVEYYSTLASYDPETGKVDFEKLQQEYRDEKGLDLKLTEPDSWDDAFDPNTKKFTGKLSFATYTAHTHDISINDPDLRQQTTRLQYMDLLAGQYDRSSGNYFVHQSENGVVVTGIDNDLAWGTEFSSKEDLTRILENNKKGDIKMCGLPQIADQSTKNAFDRLNSNPSQLDEMFKDLLSPEEIAAAKGRLSMICDHLADLAQDGKIIQDDQWEQATANSFFESATPSDSYLARDQKYFKKD